MNISKPWTFGLYFGIAAMGLATLAAPHANAALIAVDLAELAGADTHLTRDTVSGLEWLDVNLTVNTSYSVLTGGGALINGGALNGLNPLTGAEFAANPFRHATLAEFLTLLSNAGIPDLDVGFTNANYAPNADLLALIGTTLATVHGFAMANGYLADVVPPLGERATASVTICASSHPGCTGAGIATGPVFSGEVVTTHTAGGFMHPNVGHFLIRTAPSAVVPEPTSAALMLAALAALTLGRRRRGIG